MDKNKDGFLEKSEFQTFLNNIGAGDKLTSAELDEIIAEMVGGGDPGKVNGISVERAKEVMLEEIKER